MPKTKPLCHPEYGPHTNAFRLEALSLAEEMGMPDAAFALGLPYKTLYNWKRKKEQMQKNKEHPCK